jgi:hypothetical protein
LWSPVIGSLSYSTMKNKTYINLAHEFDTGVNMRIRMVNQANNSEIQLKGSTR